MSKKYAFFHQLNGVYLGSQFFAYEPKGSDFGSTNAFVVEVSDNFAGEPCKYDSISNQITPLTIEQNDELLNKSRLTTEELLLQTLEENYNASQNLYVESKKNSFVIPLKSDKGYSVFKEKVISANLYGSAEFLCFEKKTGSMQILTGITKEQWIEIGKKAESVSTRNYIQYQSLQQKILERSDSIDLSFPTVETIKI